MRRFNDAVVRGADFDLVGVEDRHGQAVVARVCPGTLVQLVLDHVHATPAGCVARSEGLGCWRSVWISFILSVGDSRMRVEHAM